MLVGENDITRIGPNPIYLVSLYEEKMETKRRRWPYEKREKAI